MRAKPFFRFQYAADRENIGNITYAKQLILILILTEQNDAPTALLAITLIHNLIYHLYISIYIATKLSYYRGREKIYIVFGVHTFLAVLFVKPYIIMLVRF